MNYVTVSPCHGRGCFVATHDATSIYPKEPTSVPAHRTVASSVARLTMSSGRTATRGRAVSNLFSRRRHEIILDVVASHVFIRANQIHELVFLSRRRKGKKELVCASLRMPRSARARAFVSCA